MSTRSIQKLAICDTLSKCETYSCSNNVCWILKNFVNVDRHPIILLPFDHKNLLLKFFIFLYFFWSGTLTTYYLRLPIVIHLEYRSRREKRTFVFELHCNFTIKGHYSLQGRLLLFNLDTDGNAKIKICKEHCLIWSHLKTIFKFLLMYLTTKYYVKSFKNNLQTFAHVPI